MMDLRFRHYGIEIKIPPLRERFDHLPDFIDCFMANADRKVDMGIKLEDGTNRGRWRNEGAKPLYLAVYSN